MSGRTDFDVVICGGGLAGLTLARQFKLELPHLSVAVVDRLARPLGPMRDTFAGIYFPQSIHDLLVYNFPKHVLPRSNGFLHDHLVPRIHRLVIANKPAAWTRMFFVKDYSSQPGPG